MQTQIKNLDPRMRDIIEGDKDDKTFDLIVIGGGPSGMMAAGRASERGLKVLILEKNDTLGKKLLITGGGRCNVTNAEFDDRKLLDKFKDDGKFLFSAFSKWSVKETMDFFHLKEMPTKVENELRVFPLSNSAQSVWNVLVDYMKKGNVMVFSNKEVTGFVKNEVSKKIIGVKVKGGEVFSAASYILATGGKSRPETGSTGEGFKWLKELGHTIIEPSASLVPLTINEPWIKNVAGLTLTDIKIHLLQNGVKQESKGESKRGKLLFTHVGVSGPTILNMSKDVSELLKYGEVVVSLDLLPAYDYGTLNTKLQDIFKIEHKKKFKNSLKELVPSSLAPIIVQLSKINPDTACNSITREERLKLVTLLKHFNMRVKGLLGVDKAIVTSGGVELSEVDFKTMQSRLFPNLYLIGDILNIDFSY